MAGRERLALGAAIQDATPATPFMDGRINGKAMKFAKAYLKIGEDEYSTDSDNSEQGATIEAEVTTGETELLAYFDLEDGTPCNAFYVYVEKMAD